MAKTFKQLVCSMRDNEIKVYDRLKNGLYTNQTDHKLCMESLRMNLIVRNMLMKYRGELKIIYGDINLEELIKRVIQDRIRIRRNWLKQKNKKKMG